MSDTFVIKRNDTSPRLLYKLDPPVKLQGASVVFNMTPTTAKGATAIDRAVATVESADDGIVAYTFTAAQTAIAGLYAGEFEVTFADSSIETYPNNGFLRVKIPRDLN